MAISLKSLLRSSVAKPPRLWTYGTAGVGKTTLGMMMPNPVFIQTEDSAVDVPTFGVLKTYADVIGAIMSLYQEEHDFQSVALDSIDHLEPIIWREACRLNNWASIEAPDYGKGYAAALDVWRTVLDGFDALRDEKNMTVMFIGHSEIRRFDSPETEPYDRYQPKLQKSASALVQEHVDAVLFAGYRVMTQKADAGFNKKIVRGAGGGERLLRAQERPAWLAKNRYNMPESLPLEWNAIAQYIPFYHTPQQQQGMEEGSKEAPDSVTEETETESNTTTTAEKV